MNIIYLSTFKKFKLSEVKGTLMKMKIGRVVGSNYILIEVWKCIGVWAKYG